ncbi:bifunctional [glutamate--ammonia ligase]-adenylyl-L-tyrosine phosphorylase/[glutamate--ammonia-ligase] adenylyltransferase [Castellaniella caeni]|uniref:bifunctional [glutamate--ammonia ligase]-adenylyl-L-tyrosine phosphorylase/[glutamate--ammonia-ligase] adenylyltransferase n=1 Tax=Castellaniella caeni TaxID=266123 RepID=UPI0008311AF0|nr:bifunctional [glutamate--ammonia ligase]-adenylyl-L-tyrosine phosphorylase/[glutamate--ammonia-ligase] adenylyltransferase [Castellaniella caeni]
MPSAIILEPALQWSGVLRRHLAAHPQDQGRLIADSVEPLTRKTLQQWYEQALAHDPAPERAPLQRALRQLRLRVFHTLMVRDLAGLAPLHEVVAAMSALADLAVGQAYACAMRTLMETHGTPRHPETGAPQDMLILGMGKLGGKELNVSSDIDLIMLYDEEGETDGRRRISHHEFYGKVCRLMMPILSELDADGYVFRTDLRLRPDGDSGPLAWSLAALENYLVAQGREWERYAWLKARLIPCPLFDDTHFTRQGQALESLRRPFVYRKYFDFDALSALRGLRERIRQDWQRRASARHGVDTQHNIKLGEGGIREVEFVIQLNQLIRGGRQPSLQQRNLLAALRKQHRAGILDDAQARGLEDAYCFLRRLEHRLQYREDEQTHLLPRDPSGMAALAQAMGHADMASFQAVLERHRAYVAHCFQDAFRIAGMGGEAPAQDLEEVIEALPAGNLSDEQARDMQTHIDHLLDSHRIQSLPRVSQERLQALLPGLVRAATQTDNPPGTLLRLLDLVEHIAQRSAYLALLAEYPETLARVARIVSASPWASQYLTRYPLLLDSLIEWRSLMEAPDFPALAEQLRTDLDACVLPDGQPDVEQQMNLMRDVQHQVTFQLLAQDLENTISVEGLADHLSALADLMLAEAIHRVWPQVLPRERRANPGTPHFAIIAYGKLGGKEIGYASDLDLVFLYDDPDQEAGERYAKLGRRVASWLATLTSSGRLYEIDLRLRPDGDAGLLALPIDAFEHYQLKQAWPWEHQALTRARFVAGDPAIGARFEAFRQRILLMPRDIEALRREVLSMRDKISQGHPNRSADFDIKHDRGGMVDIEFITQFLVLSQSAAHPELLGNLGNIALLGLAAQAGLIPVVLAADVADAYRVFRRRQHALRLQGAEKARVPASELVRERDAVRQLWGVALEGGCPGRCNP